MSHSWEKRMLRPQRDNITSKVSTQGCLLSKLAVYRCSDADCEDQTGFCMYSAQMLNITAGSVLQKIWVIQLGWLCLLFMSANSDTSKCIDCLFLFKCTCSFVRLFSNVFQTPEDEFKRDLQERLHKLINLNKIWCGSSWKWLPSCILSANNLFKSFKLLDERRLVFAFP